MGKLFGPQNEAFSSAIKKPPAAVAKGGPSWNPMTGPQGKPTIMETASVTTPTHRPEVYDPSSDLGMGYASEISAPSAPMPFAQTHLIGEKQSVKRKQPVKRRLERTILVDPDLIDVLPEDAVRPFRVPNR